MTLAISMSWFETRRSVFPEESKAKLSGLEFHEAKLEGEFQALTGWDETV